MMEPEAAVTFLTAWTLGISPSVAQLAHAQFRIQPHSLLTYPGRAAMHEAAHGIVASREGLRVSITLNADGKTGRCFVEGDERAQAIAALAGPAIDLLLGVTLDRPHRLSEHCDDFDLAQRCVQVKRFLGLPVSERDLAARSVAAVCKDLPAIERCARVLRVWGELGHQHIRQIVECAQ